MEKLKDIRNKGFQKLLNEHKHLIDCIRKLDLSKPMGILTHIQKTAVELVLLYADFKCQYPGCGSDKRLTIHHLIKRNIKIFMDLKRYLAIRNFWSNQIVLCVKHHAAIDGGSEVGMKVISEEKIAKIKRKFGIKND